MSNPFEHPGYEESILYSNDDYEPYGYVAPQLLSVSDAGLHTARLGNHERVIEAALLQKFEI